MEETVSMPASRFVMLEKKARQHGKSVEEYMENFLEKRVGTTQRGEAGTGVLGCEALRASTPAPGVAKAKRAARAKGVGKAKRLVTVFTVEEGRNNPSGERVAMVFNLKKKWFEQIARGWKRIEYRDVKPYWKSRIEKLRHGDVIEFRNGYTTKSERMRAMVLQWDVGVCPYVGWNSEYYRVHFDSVVDMKAREGGKTLSESEVAG